MTDLEEELAAARSLEVETLADRIEEIGFECTRCGACCKADRRPEASTETDSTGGDHTATVFPDEARTLAEATDQEFRDVVRPMPFGLTEGNGETFEWALATDSCGDCTFYAEDEDSDRGTCTVYDARPLICRTYPFSVAIGSASLPQGSVVQRAGPVQAHECEGLGRDIDRSDALSLARTLKRRTVRELEEAIAVRESYNASVGREESVVVFDSEGPKRPDGTPIDPNAPMRSGKPDKD